MPKVIPIVTGKPRKIIDMLKRGCRAYEIAKVVGLSKMEVIKIVHSYDLRFNDYSDAEYKKRYNTPDKPAQIVNGIEDTFGKSNPFESAKQCHEIRKHMTEAHGYTYYKGKKLDMPIKWTEVMRDYNAIRVRNGQKQFANVQDWVV